MNTAIRLRGRTHLTLYEYHTRRVHVPVRTEYFEDTVRLMYENRNEPIATAINISTNMSS